MRSSRRTRPEYLNPEDDLAAGAPKEAEVRESDLEVDDGRILHTYDVGPTERDDELVLLWHHGTPNIGAPPEPLFPAAEALGLRWIGYDRPGYGGSAPRPDATVASAANDAVRVADHLGIDRFAVFGHSVVDRGPWRAAFCWGIGSFRSSRSRPGPVVGRGPRLLRRNVGWQRSGIDRRGQGRPQRAELILATGDFDPESFTTADWSALNGEWSWFDGIVTAGTAHGFGGMIDDLLAAMSPWGFDPEPAQHADADHAWDGRSYGSKFTCALACRTMSAGRAWLEAGQGHISVLGSARSALEWVRARAVS